ncbi:MAG TPA: HD domain-containing protein [Verrucomicrobiae bacterium]|nr:HD domain-containing protein [Verrucomicrobiae bacterium]
MADSGSTAPKPSADLRAAPVSRPVAVIDIGASAIRMRIAEVGTNGVVRNLESLQQAVRLGKDTFSTGHIQSATIEECIKVLLGFRSVMTEYGVTRDDQIRAVATSAVREADNRYAFVDRLYMATQINVEVIEGAEENRLTYIAVQDVLRQENVLKNADAIIVDVGGGSTELVLTQNGSVTFANSYRLGSLRMRESLETFRAPADRARTILDQHIHRLVVQLYRNVPVDKVKYMVAISGDAQFAASLLSREWADARITVVDVKTFSSLAEQLVPVPVDELVGRYHIPYQEAETVGPTLLAYQHLARAFHVKQILVPKSSLREGLLKELAAGGSWTEEFSEQAIQSALALGEKYSFDEKHSKQVAELSVRLFRELQPEHRLEKRFELLLRIAALLHEVGMFIGDRSHHKHSMYIIMNSELFGLTKRDIMLIALVARYHRRSTPRPYHEEYTSLDRDSRIAVAKMAAILRVADALDRDHMQQAGEMAFAREPGQFVITVRNGAADLTLARLALREKGNLFEEIFGMKAIVRSSESNKGLVSDG